MGRLGHKLLKNIDTDFGWPWHWRCLMGNHEKTTSIDLHHDWQGNNWTRISQIGTDFADSDEEGIWDDYPDSDAAGLILCLRPARFAER